MINGQTGGDGRRHRRWRITAALLCAMTALHPLPSLALSEDGAVSSDRSGLDPMAVGSVEPASSDVLERQRRQTAADLVALSQSIELSEETIRSLDAEIAALSEDQGRVRAAMISAAEAQKGISREIAATEERVDRLATEEGTIKASLRERRGLLAQVLAALERMGRKPPPALLVKPNDALGSVRSAILLGAVVPAIHEQTTILVADLERLASVRAEISAEKQRFAEQLTRHRKEEQRLERLIAEKQRLEAANRDRRAAEAARAADLAAKATDLKDLIASLQADVEQARASEAAEAERRAAEEKARELARVAAEAEAETRSQANRLEAERLEREQNVIETRRTARIGADGDPETLVTAQADVPLPGDEAPQDGPALASAETSSDADTETAAADASNPDAEEAVEVAALDTAAEKVARPSSAGRYDIASLRRQAPRLAPSAAFSTMKKRLSRPVAGKQLIGFGEKDDIGRETTGASFAARAQDVVTAPADANVLYAGPFRSYGQLLILDAGDGYHVVLAGMARIDVEPGSFVSAGEPVATMGAKRLASIAVAEFGVSEPALYVEFRKDGKPVDPSPWWIDQPSGRTRNDS
ncbi:murein hydrolase activator EnvC family protein [Aurantimonas coralicida]|uniref:murein hydrolase activator EnvC family protein n=1 Tax=Aurantimonas coralicida TaxID=182270 RepID=UPI001D1968B2|nr:peptidoglycan DD-metalloendopeptidase family protein [Aurantimonas coralicida]MCC4295931.1 peptidoglycan DD-metalloendopeptidase family protein [Aurantimonas coralicida]